MDAALLARAGVTAHHRVAPWNAGHGAALRVGGRVARRAAASKTAWKRNVGSRGGHGGCGGQRCEKPPAAPMKRVRDEVCWPRAVRHWEQHDQLMVPFEPGGS